MAALDGKAHDATQRHNNAPTEAGALSRTRSSGVWFFAQLHSSIFPESVRVLRSRWPSDA